MTQRTIRVLYPNEMPAVNPNCYFIEHYGRSVKCTFPGMMVEIMNILASSMNVQVERIRDKLPKNQTKAEIIQKYAIQNRTIDDHLMAAVESGVVDTVAYALQRTNTRAKRVLFSEVVYKPKLYMLHHDVDHSNRAWTFFQVYDRHIWCLIGVILLAEIIFHFVNSWIKHGLRKKHVSESFWYALQLHLGRPIHEQSGAALRFNQVFVSFLQAATILGLYSSWIVSLSFRHQDQGLHDWEHLFEAMRSGQTSVALPANDWFRQRISEASSHPFVELNRLQQEIPSSVRLCAQRRGCLAMVNSSASVTPLLDDSTLNRVLRYYCRVAPPRHPLLELEARLIFSKRNHTLALQFNKAIRKNQLMLTMIYNKYAVKFIRTAKPCPVEKGSVDQPYQGLLLIYCLLIGMATLVFVLERLRCCRGRCT